MSDRRNASVTIRALSAYSSQGARSAQEDCVLSNREKKIFVVADGFGGPTAGTAAAKTACESVHRFLEKEAGDLEATFPFVFRSYFSLPGNVLFNALIFANRKVQALNQKKGVHERGGASAIAAYMDGDLLALANVGACSAWLFRDGEMCELVVPRTYAKLRDPFAADPPAEWQAPLMSLGTAEDLEPEIFEYQMRAGDWLLLQTDGLTHATRQALLDIKSKQLTPEQGIQEVTRMLEGSQSSDNRAISLVIF